MTTSLTPEQRDVVDRIRSGRPQRPLTPDEIAAVVERVRQRMPLVQHGRRPGAGEAAARAAHDEGIGYREAGKRYGVDQATVFGHYKRLYPGEPRKRGPKPGRERDSASRQAAIVAHDEGLTYAQAGERFGVTGEAVRLQHAKLYPGERRLPGKRPGTAPTIAAGASLKRIAWAYGCAKKGSDEERQLRELLVEKAKLGGAP